MAARAYSGKKPKNLKHTLRVFLSYLGRHKKMLAVVAVLVTISAGANLLGTYMIRPVVNGLADGDVHTLLRGVLITALIFGCGALAAYGYTQTMVKAAQQVVFDIRRDLFEHVQTLPLQFFDSRRHGDIMSLFTNDIDTMADALNNSFAMVIQSFIQIVGTLTLLYILNWRLSLIVTVCYGIMFWYIKFSGKRSKGYYTKQQNSLGELNGYIEELITGQKVVKVFHHEEESFTEFCKKNEELRKAGTGAQGYAATMVPVVVSISYVNYAIVAVLGGLLALHGKADIGSLASYLVFVRQAALPINQFTQQSNFLLSALAGAERVFDVMSLEPEIDEGKVELVNVKEENGALAVCEETTGRWAWKRPDGTMTELKGDVRFENVDFGYTADRLILKNISLYAKPGQKIAFVGSTGAGKTTITNLINRFYDVQGGAVVYDGIDVKDIEKDALRHSLGIVLQRIAERIDLILSLPDPRSHIGLVLLPAVAVRSFVECVCVWINVDAHKLAADQACDQVSQLRVVLRRNKVRAQLCYRVTQPHGRDISGDDVGAAVLHFLYGCVEGIGVASFKHINDFRLVFQFFSQA